MMSVLWLVIGCQQGENDECVAACDWLSAR